MRTISKTADGLSLGPGEEIIYTKRRTLLSYVADIGMAAIVLFVILNIVAAFSALASTSLGIGGACCGFNLLWIAILVVVVLLLKKKNLYVITNQRVYARTGLGGRNVNEIPINRVTGSSYNQSFFGRILGFGDLVFNSASGSVAFKGVKEPKKIQQRLKEIKSSVDKQMEQDQRIKRIEDRYYTGEITEQQYRQAVDRIKGRPPRQTMQRKGEPPSENKPTEGEKDTKFCKHCGAEIDADSKFCEECGNKL